jgi:gliding motility-associated-like protein
MNRFLNLLFIFCFLFCTKSFCQKEANTWCFGANTGLSFSTSPPTAIYSSVNTIEGIATISDKNGDLLFYTDGLTVYSRNHLPMMNGTGLFGRMSSTEAAVIVPKPGDTDLYYVFTADASANSFGYHGELGYNYSIVDMSQNNGMGMVIVKNVTLYSPSSEKLAVTKHRNGVYYWIMTHSKVGSDFNAYLFDCNGLSTPVMSTLGTYQPAVTYPPSAIGYMKFSPDGSKLATACTGVIETYVFDFDNETGIVSNANAILSYYPFNYISPKGQILDLENVYGVEFSPNSKLLYLSCIDEDKIVQIDLTNFNDEAMTNSAVSFYTSRSKMGSLQLGPDQKIYIAYDNSANLGVINAPDVYGAGCNITSGPALAGSYGSHYGLPTFVSSFLDPIPEIITKIEDCKVTFSLKHQQGGIQCHWDFGDVFSSSDTSNIFYVAYQYPRWGTYQVTAEVITSEGCSVTYKTTVTVDCPENLFIPTLITPNGDDKNDSFEILNLYLYPDNTLSIYNRWGEQVYQKTGYDNTWTGADCSDGVYYYLLTSPDFKSDKKGVISILRGSE